MSGFFGAASAAREAIVGPAACGETPVPMRRLFLTTILLAAACGEAPSALPAAAGERAAASPAPTATPAPAQAVARPWLDMRGTSIVGFGLLRVVPRGPGGATFRIRYREVPDGYATRGNVQVFVLPADAFATKEAAFAGEFLAFARTEDEARTGQDGALRVETSFRADRERELLVGYGPWTAPDAGRPAGDVPVFSIDVTSDDGASEWIESEAGELITTNWTNRPEVARGTPCDDATGGGPVWIEVRPMIVYDGRMVRTPADAVTSADVARLRADAERLAAAGDAVAAADARERADDLAAHAARADRRLVVTPTLAERFRRVPIRWR